MSARSCHRITFEDALSQDGLVLLGDLEATGVDVALVDSGFDVDQCSQPKIIGLLIIGDNEEQLSDETLASACIEHHGFSLLDALGAQGHPQQVEQLLMGSHLYQFEL